MSTVTPEAKDLPAIISVDDHVMEPKTLWQEQLPPSMRERGPRVVREKVKLEFVGGHYGVHRNAEDGDWCDVWLFEDLATPTGLLHAPAGIPRKEQRNVPAVYEDLRRGTYDRDARLEDMTLNHVEAAICFPNIFPRFAGQGFAERDDKELGLRCLQIYNDWMIDDWCGGPAKGRLIPLTLVPLWDTQLAADEVRRCAAKGSHAIAFSENPSKLGFPSLYTGQWDVLWEACQETETTVSMHIGSSSSMPTTSPDAPLATSMCLYAQNAQASLADWIFSCTLTRFPKLKISYAESQAGWVPFQLERMDSVWRDGVGGVDFPVAPSEQAKGRVWSCIFDDLTGLKNRDEIGIEAILFETDYPHSDGTFPESRNVAQDLFSKAGMDAEECRKVLRTNAITCYGLERFGITE
ncbi:MAG: amidohydrolase family protein [Candidatus Binatia bacterium]|nr:amidohydrolase family protein [Candidatus Binatia bacterium]